MRRIFGSIAGGAVVSGVVVVLIQRLLCLRPVSERSHIDCPVTGVYTYTSKLIKALLSVMYTYTVIFHAGLLAWCRALQKSPINDDGKVILMTVTTEIGSAVDSTMLKEPAQNSVTRGSTPEVRATVEGVIADIRERGDAAVREYSQKFDKYAPETFLLSQEQLDEIMARVPEQTIADIKFVQEQVRTMAVKQLESLTDFEIETLPGVFLGQKNVPVQAAGAYIPGGKYPLLASAHMTIITAKVAGVERVAACTPLIQGEVPDATVAAMYLAGADEIYLLGGIQAVAALAIGTETIKPVNMLAGPGNAFVAEAKRQLFGEVGIDLFAGPTEVAHRGR
ncbi:histidinol dehydrogenase [Arthrobacter psychrolactophilus]